MSSCEYKPGKTHIWATLARQSDGAATRRSHLTTVNSSALAAIATSTCLRPLSSRDLLIIAPKMVDSP